MLKTGSLHIIWHDIISSRIYLTVCNASVKNGYSNSIYKIETATNNNIKMPINDTMLHGARAMKTHTNHIINLQRYFIHRYTWLYIIDVANRTKNRKSHK